MISLVLCVAAFLGAVVAANRSLGAGLGFVVTVGYAYGITRANLQQPLAHLVFDVAVLGLYVAQLWRSIPREERPVQQGVRSWVILLCAWPVVLFCLSPQRDPLVELVGLRSNIFLLPFVLLGARLSDDDMQRLAMTIAVLNLGAAGLAAAQYVYGIEPFYPYTEVTDLIYRSNDLLGRTAYRLPSSFPNAHVFGGTMVMTIPWLAGALMHPRLERWKTILYMSALAASLLSVFAAGARTPIVALALMGVAVTVSSRFKGRMVTRWAVVVALVLYVVAGDPRLQRFLTLGDTALLQERITNSVNQDFFDLVGESPLGNGLAGGGTSIPYFLQERQQIQMTLENEYARIVLELGVPGLLMWVGFIAWVATRSVGDRESGWFLGQRLAWVGALGYFVVALTGIGLLTAVPQSSLMLLNLGWAIAAGARGRQRAAMLRLVPRARRVA
jgi:O-Antigen ligase